ncbi:hypothetical protein Rs2_26678 [Raphanus sativus]|nr:hypothetical protein Rs2_26678 [Raphanus sativus]
MKGGACMCKGWFRGMEAIVALSTPAFFREMEAPLALSTPASVSATGKFLRSAVVGFCLRGVKSWWFVGCLWPRWRRMKVSGGKFGHACDAFSWVCAVISGGRDLAVAIDALRL